jgi:hypothetical protein
MGFIFLYNFYWKHFSLQLVHYAQIMCEMHAEFNKIHYLLQKSWQGNHKFFAMIKSGMTSYSTGRGKGLVQVPAPQMGNHLQNKCSCPGQEQAFTI